MTKGPNDLGKGSKMVAVTHEEKLASAVNPGSINHNNPSIMITDIFIFTIQAIKDHLIVDEKCVLSNCQWEQDEFTPCSSCKGRNAIDPANQLNLLGHKYCLYVQIYNN